jgi:GMP synthase (glutamine-hydrolysing)
MKILIIDNHIDPEHWGARELTELTHQVIPGATLSVRRAPHEDLPHNPSQFDAIIISGSKTSASDQSPWVIKFDEWLRKSVQSRIATLGICYGHQSLVRALGGVSHVKSQSTQEYGWGEVELSAECLRSPLFKEIPSKFHTFQWHQDEVVQITNSMKCLALSPACAIQAFELTDAPIFGIQFHAERTLEAGKKAITERLKNNPKTAILNSKEGNRLYQPELGKKILSNFISLAQTARTSTRT